MDLSMFLKVYGCEGVCYLCGRALSNARHLYCEECHRMVISRPQVISAKLMDKSIFGNGNAGVRVVDKHGTEWGYENRHWFVAGRSQKEVLVRGYRNER